MTDDRRARLRRRYLSLGVGELVAAGVFAGAAATTVAPRIGGLDGEKALWAALVPLLVVLVQAGVYWLLARGWVERRPMPAALAVLYRGFRVTDVMLLAAGLAGVILWLPGSPGMTVFIVAVIWLFGVVEYINYFVARLSYPAGRWLGMIGQWRVPRLILDVRSASTLT